MKPHLLLFGLALGVLGAIAPGPALALHQGPAPPGSAPLRAGKVAGRVLDGSGRPLAGASVALLTLPDSVTVDRVATDRLGRFGLTSAAPGPHEVIAELIGYSATSIAITLSADTTITIDIRLEESAVELPGVEVEVSRARERFRDEAGTTTRTIARAELKALPGLGEADVLRAIEVMPGVVSTSDYTSAFNVRGGSADQNLILLDGIPVYNPFHLGGLFSVFNADMVSRAELLAGGFPAEYGGRVASVLAVESDASGSGTSVDAGLSLLATRAALGADVPDLLGLTNARVRGSVRRSYFDAVLAPVMDFPYHLTDVQLFGEAWTPGGGRVIVTAYTGRDVLNFAEADTTIPLRVRWNWGNDVVGLGWTQPLGGGRALDIRAGYTRFASGILFPDFDDTDITAAIGQWLLRGDVDVVATRRVSVRAGAEANRFRNDNSFVTGGTEFFSGHGTGWLLGGYAEAKWRPYDRWLLEAGIRVDDWQPGAGSTVTVSSPRLASKWFFANGNAAVKVAVGRFAQFLHSVRDEELPLGIDVWLLAGDGAPHTISDQVQGGIEAFLPSDWFVALEGYRRTFDGVVTNNYADDPNDPTDDVLPGTGLSYGADLLLRRDRGRMRPALAVSWLRATRDFADPTLGIDPAPVMTYPPIFDRRLDVELVMQADVGNLELGFRWHYGTGLPFTRPVAGYRLYTHELTSDGKRRPTQPADDSEPGIAPGPRNAERYPPYHRLDLSARRTYRRGWGSYTPYIDVLNIYNRKNPLFYLYEFNKTPAVRSGVSMFPLLPTFGVEVRF